MTDFASSYFGNRIVRHVKTDMKRLRDEGFSIVVHTCSENDFQFYRGTLADIVTATTDLGLRVWLDAWGLGGIFGGEAFSAVALREPEWLQIAQDGTRLPACCPNNPDFRDFIAEWIDVSCNTEAEAIFWDEPHFFSDNTGRSLGCSCTHCHTFAERMELSKRDEAREASLTAFLVWACDEVHKRGKESVVCLLPSDHSEGGRTSWEHVASAKGLSNIGTVPFWALRGEDPEPCITQFGQELISVTRKASLQSHIWIQGFRIPSGREDEITKAVICAANLGTDVIAVWGFDACESMSYLACDEPQIAWQAFLRGVEKVLQRN